MRATGYGSSQTTDGNVTLMTVGGANFSIANGLGSDPTFFFPAQPYSVTTFCPWVKAGRSRQTGGLGCRLRCQMAPVVRIGKVPFAIATLMAIGDTTVALAICKLR